MMTLRNIAKIASSRDFTDHTSRFLCGSHKNHVTEMDDLRNHIWLFGAVGGLIFFVSSSQNHGRRLWVSLTYEKIIYPTGRKSHNNTKLTCIIHRFLYLRRACRDSFIIYLWHGNEQPKIFISTSSRGNLVHLRRARWHMQKCLYRI